jgi:hypothetical protein
MKQLDELQRRALVGDVVVLLVLTVIGFATHRTLDAFGRMLLTAGAALVAWAAVAPFLHVYRHDVIESPRNLWRVAWAWVLAAPLATFLRGAALRLDIPPIFVFVVMLTNGFALLAWRTYLGWRTTRDHSGVARSISNPL